MSPLIDRILHPLWIVKLGPDRNVVSRLSRFSWGNLFYREGEEIAMSGKILTPVDPEIDLLESVVYAKDQPEYIPLPVRRSHDGEVVSRWKPNWRARLAVAFGADFYLTMLTFNQPLTPIRVSVEKPEYVKVTQ